MTVALHVNDRALHVNDCGITGTMNLHLAMVEKLVLCSAQKIISMKNVIIKHRLLSFEASMMKHLTHKLA